MDFEVNVFGIVNAVRSFVPRMLAAGSEGHIVNTASVAAFVAGPAAGPVRGLQVRRHVARRSASALDLPRSAAHRRVGADAERLRHRHRPHGPGPLGALRGRRHRRWPGDGRRAGGRDRRRPRPGSRRAHRCSTASGPGDFLIPTRPSYADQIRNRYDALLERRLPGPAVVD